VTFFDDIIAFMEKFFRETFNVVNPDIDVITSFDVMMALFWSIVLTVVIASTYRGTHKGISYSQSFTQTLVLLGLIVSAIMMVVGSNLARAFTLIGTLTIIRFRNAVKETRDAGFIFFVLVIGMACGSRFYFIAIMVTVIGCLTVFIMTYMEFGRIERTQDILEFNYPSSRDYSDVYPTFKKYLHSFSLLSLETTGESVQRISFVITFKTKKKIPFVSRLLKRAGVEMELMSKTEFIAELQGIEMVEKIKLLDGSSFVET